MPTKKLYEASFNGQTPNVGGPRRSDDLTDREIANFTKKKRLIKASANKQRGEMMPGNEIELAADLELRRNQLRNKHHLLVALGLRRR